MYLQYRLHDGLKQYGEFVRARWQASEFLLVDDPRTDEERMHAADLHDLAKSELLSGRASLLAGGLVNLRPS